MKKRLLILIMFAFLSSMHSQNSKTGIIHYNHIDKHYGVSYNSYLVFNQSKSYFVTAMDSLGLSNSSIETNNNPDVELIVEAVDFNEVKKTRREGLQVYLDKITDSIYFANAFTLTSKMIYAKEEIPKIKWDLGNETKKIGGFDCKKATANFRGRDYVCWYTEEIPLPYGPWKLQGLPGIILEATSKDAYFEINFKKIKYPEKNISVPSSKNTLLKKAGGKFISFNDYKLLQKKHIKYKSNLIKIMEKKHKVQGFPFDEKENFLEVFGF